MAVHTRVHMYPLSWQKVRAGLVAVCVQYVCMNRVKNVTRALALPFCYS